MTPLPIDWIALCGTVFALGVRHGLDADHLAAIDSVTRFNHATQSPIARWCGVLFSAGHGCVVIVVSTTAQAIFAANAIATWGLKVPAWVENVGGWISAAILLLLSALNLAQLMRSRESDRLKPVGLLGRLLARFARTRHPAAVALLGALFALSFDTLSQALLFSATAVEFQGWISALVLGVLFTLGMTLLDGLKGAWLARLLRTADRTGMSIARAVGSGVSVLGLLVAGTGMARLLSARVDSIIQAESGFYAVVLIGLVIVIPVLLITWPKSCIP